MNWKFWIALFIAVLLDLADWGIVGLIPFLGDIFDIIGIALLFPFIGVYALLGAVEFIPILGDLAPSFTVAVILSRTGILKKMMKGVEAP